MDVKPRTKWAESRYGKWHAYIFFDGYDTLGSPCGSFVKVPDDSKLVDTPGSQGMEKICVTCSMAVQGIRKRYNRKVN